MPKIVDHDARRRELARAVWQVIRERGVAGASVRAVAQRAGWSPSSVQYYFSTQAELLNFAMRVIADETERRADPAHLPADPHEAALALFDRLLPLDPDARTANEVWVAFLSRVLVDAEAGAFNAASNEWLAEVFRDQLQRLVAAGRVSPAIDLDLEVDRLRVLFDGLALHLVTDAPRMPPERARELIRHHLETLSPSAAPDR
ncbi:TetR/AcrR family transcriptional regulator [Goodfellowiella coeruleoviolacea]|uniref:Transcriptional regulator, TetR family n=1 Tax=Goodfellowiella coeruleoviolacea TaxID=334858 RepID=A0AAE3KLH9_9PSEU|nr:TetR family transcriptional regulator C-terminal domain-containing protein [Goodfellowiella coeruleoviolacea]MCP2170344.1 transcriptional regulator, TetR family [Goodfellowiella coeruleoviolacea]